MSTTLLNVPPVSQLTTVTGDGRPSENAQYDCVPASVDMLCRYVLGTPENSIFNPDNLKDKAYGENWVNEGTAASAYVAYCQTLGVHLYSVDVASYQDLVTLVRSYIRDHNQPCLFTRDDPYVDQRVHPDWSHVCVFKGQDDAGLTAHDPYINQPVYKTDAGWVAVLREKQIWIAERIQQEENMQIDISNPEVARYFTALSATAWQCNAYGPYVVHDGILGFYKQYGNAALCGLTNIGLPKSNEVVISQNPYVVLQWFERGVVVWDPAHAFDNPPGSGPAYMAQLYNDKAATDPRLVTARQQIQQLQAQLAAQPPSQADQQLQARISKAIADLQGQ